MDFIKYWLSKLSWVTSDYNCVQYCSTENEENDSDDDRNHFCTRCQSYHPKYYECLMKR